MTVLAALFVGAGQGCNDEATRDAQASAKMLAKATRVRKLNLSDGPGANLGKYKMHWPKRTQEEVAARMTKVATVMRGKPVRFSGNSQMQNLPDKPFDDQNLTVTYDATHDDLSLRDDVLLTAEQHPKDVGEKGAKQLMKAAFKNLVAEGILQSHHYDLEDIRIGHHKLQLSSGDGTAIEEKVVEYRFRMLRKLNGIDVANNGVVIGISPTGQVSSIRMGGVEVDSSYNGIEESPAEPSQLVVRGVSTDRIQKRFDEEVFSGKQRHTVWSRKMYVMPVDGQDAIVEPMMVYRFAPMVEGPDGAATSEGARIYGFSLVDEQQKAIDLAPQEVPARETVDNPRSNRK